MSVNIHENVTQIVNNNNKAPSIVNESSNFVVVTYWWGRGNLNRNTARPCTSFYEDYLKKFNNYMLKLLNSSVMKDKSEKGEDSNPQEVINNVFDKLETTPYKFTTLVETVGKMVNHYITDVCDYKGIDKKVSNRFELLRKQYPDFLPHIENHSQLTLKLVDIVKNGIIKNKENIIALYNINNKYDSFKATYLKYKHNQELTEKNAENLKKLQDVNILLFTKTNPQDNILDSIQGLIKDIKPVSKQEININDLLQQVIDTTKIKNNLNKELTEILKTKEPQEAFDGKMMSTFDLLINILEYQAPILFETMIENWEKSCSNNNCNHLAIEYPEFAKKGGYQLAINAKPKFIKKALELCKGKSVLYIDGDMTIRKYPAIFDMKDVDFMARGWWIDPRSSYKMPNTNLPLIEQERAEMSVLYDPYNFETSGGTMFFSASDEANKLIQLWINTAENPINEGKADDRVLSLIFNTKAVLTWIRIIQLPIEYLWLTLDYDERLMEEVYDYNKAELESTIFIDHPECLTSEDTATGAGASSDRQPKYYAFLEDLTPVSEKTHEYIMFKNLVENFPDSAKHVTQYMALSNDEKSSIGLKLNEALSEFKNKLATSTAATPLTVQEETSLKTAIKELKDQKTATIFLPYLFWYYHYMGGVVYINDGNPDLEELGFVDPENPDDNAQPLDIISFKDRFGNKKHPAGDGESINQIVDINIEAAKELNLDNLYKDNSEGFVLKDMNGFIEINPSDTTSVSNKNLLRVILRLLLDNKTVLFNPISFENYNQSIYKKLVDNLNTFYKNCDLVFHPQHSVSIKRSSFYKPKIDMNQSILFRSDSRLIDFLSMNLSLEDLSVFINNGSYEFMSLIRIAFIFQSRAPVVVPPSEVTQSGGGYKQRGLPKYNINNTINEYLDEFESSIQPLSKNLVGGRAKKRTQRKNNKKLHKKKLTRRKLKA